MAAAQHKYKVGQVVNFTPAKMAMQASSREYKVVRLLPPEDGQNLYHIIGISETFERMARESDLSRK